MKICVVCGEIFSTTEIFNICPYCGCILNDCRIEEVNGVNKTFRGTFEE